MLTVLNTVNSAVQQVTSSLPSGAAPQSRQTPNSVAGHGPNTNPAAIIPSTRELGDRLAKLLQVSLGATSLTMYRRPWQILQQFIRDSLGLQIPLFPLSAQTLALFIAFFS